MNNRHLRKADAAARTPRRAVLLIICLVVCGVVCVLLPGSSRSRAAAQPERTSPDGVWQFVAATSVVPQGKRAIIPQQYRTAQLNIDALRRVLASAPVEFTAAAKTAAIELTMPLPNGVFARFRVIESPMMERKLAAQYPAIKTYSGVGIDDPTATMRFDLTPAGFHAIILSTADTIYVDPYAQNDTTNYLSYYKRDFRTDAEPLHCFVQEMAKAKAQLGPRAPANVVSGTVRSFRLALAANGEYTNFFRQAGDTDQMARGRAFAAMTTTMNRVNAIYRREVAAFMTFVGNENAIIYTDPNTDPYTGAPGTDTINNENQTNLDNVIGADNYDIGHVVGANGTGGKAALLSLCTTSPGKAKGSTGRPSPVNDPFDVDYVAHEIGHQFGANHTFNSITGENCLNQRNASTAYEPGSGSTIMGYAGICSLTSTLTANLQLNSDDYFHIASLDEIDVNLDIGLGSFCANEQTTGNTIPAFPALGSHHIPARTPFELYAADLSDADGGLITYNWEETDLGSPSPPEDDDGDRPLFRSFRPSLNPRRMFPSLQYILFNANEPPETIPCPTAAGAGFNCLPGETLPVTTRAMKFWVLARDNQDGISTGFLDLNVHSDSGPFAITQPNTRVTLTQGTRRIVTWSVANTNAAPISAANVKISLSTGGGYTFDHVLADSTPNDGSEMIVVPEVETDVARIKVESLGDPHVTFFDISDADFTITPSAIVTNTDNAGAGSLRQAIMDANDSPNLTPIVFAIPGTGVKTINLTSELPPIDTPVLIDGWTQGGAEYTGPPLIELNGAGAGVNATGLIINGGNSTVRGLAINRFSAGGIVLQFAGGNKVQGCYIGTDVTGTTAQGNVGNGISINNIPNNIIGRQTSAAQTNVISGNTVGILLTGSSATNNSIQGNYIGTNAAGSARLSNTLDGVRITNAPANTIGGTAPLTGNIISGNGVNNFGADGIEITGAASAGNKIQGNYIGLAADGNAALANLGVGIYIENAPGTIIGGTDGVFSRNVIAGNGNYGGIALIGGGSSGTFIQGNYLGTNAAGDASVSNNATNIYIESANNQITGNVISGQTSTGIDLAFGGATGNTIQTNYIGTNAAGTGALNSTGTGISVRGGANNNLIGGAQAGMGNVISGNFTAVGVVSSSNIVIQGNYVGTNPTGTAAVPNVRGVIIDGGANNTIGGTAVGARNVISGNGTGGNDHGIRLANTLNCTVQGNLIGTNAAGTVALGNGGSGIQVFNSTNAVIGGATAAARNIISANRGNGISLSSGSNGTSVRGNYIGTDANGTANLGNGLPTGAAGIEIQDGSHTIGGTGAGEGNIIAFSGCAGCFGVNNGSGIRVFSAGNQIRGNSIFGNVELGIDLSGGSEGANRVTPNDSCDADTGPNNLQNFPVLTSASSGSGNTQISGTLNSSADTTYTIDFYANPTCDASGNGEGQTYLGSTNVTTGADCNASINVTLPVNIPAGEVITATATDPQGNTSEFSACRALSAPPTVQFSAATFTVGESEGTATITVTRAGDTSGAVTVNYATANGTAGGGAACGSNSVDYVPTTGTLSWTAGDAAPKTFNVTVCDDSVFENTETVSLTLTDPTGAVLGAPAAAVLSITNDDAAPPPPAAGQVIISELRFRGPTPAAQPPNDGTRDEFIELYNATDAALSIGDPDSLGWALVTTDGTVVLLIPNGTSVPARGHLLIANSSSPGGYSLADYGGTGQAAPDLTYTADIPDNTGLALFRTASAASFDLSKRLDAVGFGPSSGALHSEGTPLPMVGAVDGQYSWARRLATGLPQDTDDNAQDFVFISTDGGAYGGVQAQLGAPGPENLSSPIQRNATVKASLVDPQQLSTAPPNRVRDTTANVCGDPNTCALGTLTIRRKFKNSTGQVVRALRFRVVDVTTLNTPNPGGAQADLRALNSGDVTVTISGGGSVPIKGLTVEQPPAQGLGGGLNSSLVIALPGGALGPNASVNVQFVLGVQANGRFRFLVNVEALSGAPAPGAVKTELGKR